MAGLVTPSGDGIRNLVAGSRPLALTLLAIIILFAAATIILTLRNFAIATMSFRRRCLRTARAVRYRLRSWRHDGAGAVRAAAPILRSFKAQSCQRTSATTISRP